MQNEGDRSKELQALTGLEPTHFADLVRTAQLIADPGGGVAGRSARVDWKTLEIPPGVLENLKTLGQTYQYELPHLAPAIVWEQLTPETRDWFMDNKSRLWEFEELFPATDED